MSYFGYRWGSAFSKLASRRRPGFQLYTCRYETLHPRSVPSISNERLLSRYRVNGVSPALPVSLWVMTSTLTIPGLAERRESVIIDMKCLSLLKWRALHQTAQLGKEMALFIGNYLVTEDSQWSGRVDSEDDFDSFRWHQWVEILDLNDEDTRPYEGKLGFAFLGFECDKGVRLNKGRSGAANGPDSIRKELSNLPCRFSEEVNLFDAGNVSCENATLEEAQDSLAKAVNKILELNLFPVLLGGGHEMAFGHYKGVLEYLKKKGNPENIGIVNFDAHFDLRPYPDGGTSGTMFRQISDIAETKGIKYSYYCIGIQKHGNTINLFKTADELGVEYLLAKDVSNMDYYPLIEKLDDFIKNQDHVYVTICSDVFSSAFAPGVSAPEPLGLAPEKVLVFLKYILRSGKTISFDIAEVSPRFDQDNTTANLASVVVFTVVKTLSKLVQ